ncbi:carbohydrate kinase [Rhodoluna sp.]|uniref:carbohydrate kinase family protein n=1 Tax=Rhodoluna sp. TaxID=1969481 RepID=UPI0025DE13B5|nr:carbohydrate kinase [Rhodoluna sp.]
MILVIGEALIDLIENRYQPGSFNAIVGGANANVALALARRDVPHRFLGRISNDRFGKIIRERLETNGVNLDLTISAPELTTLAVVSIDSHGIPAYAFYVNGTADWAWTPDELPTDVQLENLHATAIQFGCLTMAMEPGNKVIEAWGKSHFEQNSVTISHDINMRPALGFDPTTERLRVERVNSFSHLIKASDEDIEWLYGLDAGADLDAIVRGWIGDTGRVVLVTRGASGTSIYRGDRRIDVGSRKINVVDTVGAGDTFCANLLGQLSDIDALGTDAFDRLDNLTDDALAEFVRIAGVAASITCERAGCEPPTLADLNAVLNA